MVLHNVLQVDSLKRAFSKANIEKKMNKIVSQEKREKMKKSLTPNHPKSSSFKVSPLTFSIKKVSTHAHTHKHSHCCGFI